ncbi:hypothetical protein VZT92_013267 [Zoarces viviparus]|uniref:E3 ubiquitin-protein ligase n=1 Tax=Zoarces viviparus TaxID=48416 RepID=A0AAW1F399_ZOAVI
MSDNNQDEAMDYCDGSQQEASTSPDCAENKEEVQVTLSVEWSEGFQQQKYKIELEKILQSWANNKNNKYDGDCKVLSISEDGSAAISLKPAPALSELQKLSGQHLTGKDGKTVKIMSVYLSPQEVKTPKEALEEASVKLPPSSVSEQNNVPEKVQPMVQPSAASAAGAEQCTCSVNHFWYVNHIYKGELKRIEKENGVKIMAEVNVTFQGDQKDGDPQKALSEFTSLVQKDLGKSDVSIIPLKEVNPEEWKDTVNIIQRKDNKLLLTVSSEEMTVCGPRQSQDAIRKSLTATTNTSTCFGESTWPSQDTSPNIGMSIKDPLVNAGLAMEERQWKLMTTSYEEQVAKIKAKFGVDFKESCTSQGKVEVKACYKKSGGNASMESHAVRALLHLYQKITTTPLSFTQQRGAIGLTGLQSEGASGGPGLNGHRGYNTEAATGGGATAGDSAEDENCPICMDKFTNKKRLKCKHAFCEGCLAKAREIIGDICPVCKDVFGLIEGDQPPGYMTSYESLSSLPGFPGCGTIHINYDISGGIQTQKHSNPGKPYSGIHRAAYLPNNKEGKEVLALLKKAFDQKLIFTVGTSRTSGMDNQVTWNDIHHKTNITGGPQGFGYPDPGYLIRVKEELKAKGVK